MKWKLTRLVLCCLLLSGCHARMGKFQDGSINLPYVIEKINEKSMDEEWDYPLLNQTAWDAITVQDTYAMDMTTITSSYVVSSIVPAQLGELAFFQAEEAQDIKLKEIVNQRLSSLQTQWGSLLLDGDSILTEAKLGRIGEYYFLIVGRDAQKVVNYIQSLQ